MGYIIRIDDDVSDWLQKEGQTIPRSILLKLLGVDGQAQPRQAAIPTSQSAQRQATETRRTKSDGARKKLNERELRAAGVSHIVVDSNIPNYNGIRSHPRAYLDASLDSGKTNIPYFERWNERGLPNPRGDAASRVILKVGATDHDSVVAFHSGQQMKMAEFVEGFIQGTL